MVLASHLARGHNMLYEHGEIHRLGNAKSWTSMPAQDGAKPGCCGLAKGIFGFVTGEESLHVAI